MVNRVSWKQLGLVQEPGRYMFKLGWVTVTAEDLAIWAQYPEATFALYEVPGPERLNDEYRLGSVQLALAQADPQVTEPVAIAWTVDNPSPPSSPMPVEFVSGTIRGIMVAGLKINPAP